LPHGDPRAPQRTPYHSSTWYPVSFAPGGSAVLGVSSYGIDGYELPTWANRFFIWVAPRGNVMRAAAFPPDRTHIGCGPADRGGGGGGGPLVGRHQWEGSSPLRGQPGRPVRRRLQPRREDPHLGRGGPDRPLVGREHRQGATAVRRTPGPDTVRYSLSKRQNT